MKQSSHASSASQSASSSPSSPAQVIARLLPPSNVALDLDLSSKRGVFDAAGLLFQHHQGIARATVFDSLFARERLGSTGMGQGVAIPHGRIAKLSAPVGAFLRVKDAIPFEAPDAKPVTLLFFLLVPEKAANTHLLILASLAELFSDAALRTRLATLAEPAAVHQSLITFNTHADTHT
jgi:nitrogen PTS system EIIA component